MGDKESGLINQGAQFLLGAQQADFNIGKNYGFAPGAINDYTGYLDQYNYDDGPLFWTYSADQGTHNQGSNDYGEQFALKPGEQGVALGGPASGGPTTMGSKAFSTGGSFDLDKALEDLQAKERKSSFKDIQFKDI